MTSLTRPDFSTEMAVANTFRLSGGAGQGSHRAGPQPDSGAEPRGYSTSESRGRLERFAVSPGTDSPEPDSDDSPRRQFCRAQCRGSRSGSGSLGENRNPSPNEPDR